MKKKKNLYAPNATVPHTQQNVHICVTKDARWRVLSCRPKQPQTGNAPCPQAGKGAVAANGGLRAEDGVRLGRRTSLRPEAETVSRGGRRAVSPSRSSAKRERKADGESPQRVAPISKLRGKARVFLCFCTRNNFLKNSWRWKEGRRGKALAWLRHPICQRAKLRPMRCREWLKVTQGASQDSCLRVSLS